MNQEHLFEFHPLITQIPRRRQTKTAAALAAYAPSSWSRKGTPPQFREGSGPSAHPVCRRGLSALLTPIPSPRVVTQEATE